MRQIEITDSLSYNQTIGVIGEHRATQLQITLPDDMTTDVDYWIAVFKSGTRTIKSGIITDELSEDGNAIVTDGILYIKLWRELTLAPCLNLTVSAYKMDGDKAVLIASMPLIGDFYFSAANIEGETADTDAGGMAVDVATLKTDVDGLAADVTALAEDSHTHANKSTLDKFSSFEGVLPTYNEAIIPQMAIDTDYGDGNIVVIKATGLLETAENSEGEPLNVSDIVDAVDKTHEHLNKSVIDKLTDDNGTLLYDGEPIGGLPGDYIPIVTEFPTEAAEGDFIYLKAQYGTDNPVLISSVETGTRYTKFEVLNHTGYLPGVIWEGDISVEVNLYDSDAISKTLTLIASAAHESEGHNLSTLIFLVDTEIVYAWAENTGDVYFDIPLTAGWNLIVGDLDVGVHVYPLGSSEFPALPNYSDYTAQIDTLPETYGLFDNYFSVYSAQTLHGIGLYRYDETWIKHKDVDDVLPLVVFNDNGVMSAVVEPNNVYVGTPTEDFYLLLPSAEDVSTAYDNWIILQLSCTVDIDISLPSDVVIVVGEIDTTAGSHEILFTFNVNDNKWWVSQRAEATA
jgi:hypothetical protein